VDPEQMQTRLEYLHDRVTLLEKRFRCIQVITNALGSSLQMDEVLHTVAEQATTLLDSERATVFLVDDETRDLIATVIIGDGLRELVLRPGQGIAGWVAQTGKTVNVKDAYRDRRFDGTFDRMSGFRTRTILCQPMVTYGGKIIGVIQVLNRRRGYFTMEDQDLLSTITTQATITIENSKFYTQLHEANLQLTEVQESLQRNYGRLETLYRIQTEMTQQWERGAVIEGVLGELMATIPCVVCSVLLTTPSPPRFYVKQKGYNDIYMVSPAVLEGPLAAIVEKGKGLHVGQDRGDVPGALHPQIEIPLTNLLAEPLVSNQGEVFGVLALANRADLLSFTAEDLQLVRIVARQIAIAFGRLQQHEELTTANNLALIGGALSGVLHDLKSPMSVISGYVQLMEAEDDPSQRRQYSVDVLKQFKLVSTMTHEVLAFARGERQILKRNIYLQKFLEEMEQLLQQEFSGREITLSIENSCRDKLKADEGKLKRLFFNIARNARDAMPEGGTFRILVRDTGDGVEFEFSDTGSGIPEEIQDRLFQSFVTKGKKDGTGLGLAIVKNIVEQHGGTITYETGSDSGTTFVVTLPKV